MRRILYVPLLALVFAFSTGIIHACETIASERFATLDDTCGGIVLNEICYGNNTIIADFFSDAAEFEQPSDVANLLDLNTLQTVPYNPMTEEWGIALMKIQADLPDTIPGQAVTIIVMGDMNLTNDAPAETATRFDMTIPVVAQFGSNLRTFPNTQAEVAASVPANTELQAFARNEAGDWLRVVYEERPLWISRSIIAVDDDITQLPLASTRTPMQAFRVTAGVGDIACSEAPNMMLIQSPNNYEVALEINGDEVRIGSTVSLTFDDEQKLELAVLDGYARLESGRVVPTGFTVRTQIAINETSDIIDGWEGLRPLDDDELDRYDDLDELNDDTIGYPIRVPTRDEIDEIADEIGYYDDDRDDWDDDNDRDDWDDGSRDDDTRDDSSSRDDNTRDDSSSRDEDTRDEDSGGEED